MTVTTDRLTERHARLIRANGIDIAYRDLGEGPPLVLLHGALASTGPAWKGSRAAHVDHLETLGRGFRVIAPDTRGSGATVHPGGPAGFGVLSDDVVALIDELGLDRPFLAGFSEGGVTATYVALRHPDKLRALVNHAGFDVFDPEAFAHQSLRPMFGGHPGATEADPEAARRTFTQVPEMAAVFATMQADYDGAQGEGHWRTYLHQFFDRASAPMEYGVADLSRITVPTLILTGDRDPFCPAESACQAYRALPHGSLGIVPGAGHEITPGVVRMMTDFLR